MSENRRTLRSASRRDQVSPSKRQSPNTCPPKADSLVGIKRKSKRMQSALATLRTSLSQSAETALKHRKLRAQTESMLDQVTNVLKKQLAISREIVEQLHNDLEALIAKTNESREAQAKVEAELSQVKATMNQNIAQAVAQVKRQAARERHLFEDKTSTLKKELKRMNWLQQRVILLEGQRQELYTRVQEFESIKSGVSPAAFKDHYNRLVQENENLKAEVESLKEKKGVEVQEDSKQLLTNILTKVEDSSSGADEFSDDGSDDGEDFKGVAHPVPKLGEDQDLRILTGTYYILISDRRYFEIDWSAEYEILGKCEGFRCNKCSLQRRSLGAMKNHVWCKHYGGSFRCAYCGSSGKKYFWKGSVRRHMLAKHPRYC